MTSTFTKRHYTHIASSMANAMKLGNLSPTGAEFMAKQLANIFQKDNPSFSRKGFLEQAQGMLHEPESTNGNSPKLAAKRVTKGRMRVPSGEHH